MRLVFMGTPKFAVPTLERLLAEGHEVTLAVTQPDRPSGRGRKLAPPPVKEVALQHNVPVLQPRRLRDEEAREAIAAAAPEAIVVAAFGQILPRAVLELPPHGCLNVHASLLPRWRGAAPISAAILAGDEVTGVTVMLMDAGLDTGPILDAAVEPIGPADTTESLAERLARRGAELLVESLPAWQRRALKPLPQPDAGATYAPQLRKEDGELDWNAHSVDLWRRCRAFYPWPGAFTHWRGRLLKVQESAPLVGFGGSPGSVTLLPSADARRLGLVPDLLPANGRVVVVGTGDGALALVRVQIEGGKAISGYELAMGHRDLLGSRLGR